MISTTYDNKSKSCKGHLQDTIPSFIRKTYDILDERKYPDVIDWNPEGTALVIKKPTEFAQKVLPQYFKHNNLTSFVRQLNMYNFHKRRTQNIDHVYYHELFQRGKKHLLKEIRRKNHENNNLARSTEGSISDHNIAGKDTNSILYENQFLKKLYNDAMSKISIFETQIQELTVQNNSLRSQLYPPMVESEGQFGYKSVPAVLENDTTASEFVPTRNNISIPPLKLMTSHAPIASKVPMFTSATFNEESTEDTEASHDSPNVNQNGMIENAQLNAEMNQSFPLNMDFGQETKTINGLKISRGDTSIGKLFESWNSQSMTNDTIVLGKRDLNMEKGLSQLDFAEPSLKKNELSIFARRSMMSNGIEDKEFYKVFGQRGISNEDFGLDLMSFTN